MVEMAEPVLGILTGVTFGLQVYLKVNLFYFPVPLKVSVESKYTFLL